MPAGIAHPRSRPCRRAIFEAAVEVQKSGTKVFPEVMTAGRVPAEFKHQEKIIREQAERSLRNRGASNTWWER